MSNPMSSTGSLPRDDKRSMVRRLTIFLYALLSYSRCVLRKEGMSPKVMAIERVANVLNAS